MKNQFDDEIYNIEWSDIENAEMDYENYLDDIEGFFKEDFEDEEEINSETIANMKELEELTREIREKLPRLMELSEGQRLITLISDEPNDIYEGAYERIGIGAELLENGNIEIGGYEYEIGKSFEVVGKDPMLNDVLEWHQDYYSKNSHFEVETFSAEGVKYSIGCFYSYDSDDEIEKYFWDLSKTYLKDQSPELIKFLHSLIKTN